MYFLLFLPFMVNKDYHKLHGIHCVSEVPTFDSL